METVLGSIKLAFFVYGLAAVLSLVIAWIIKMIFVAVQAQKARAEAKKGADSDGGETPAPEGSA
jgi:hypothetical protein